jgi:hypothetical protein
MTPAESLLAALVSVRELDGARASFVVATTGEILAFDGPPGVGDAILGEIASHVPKLVAAASSDGTPAKTCVVRFDDGRLYVQSVRGGYFCFLSSAHAAGGLLRAALTLASRRVGHALAALNTGGTGSQGALPGGDS